jgi:hypothetical protein
MLCAFQLLASLAGGCGRQSTTTTTALAAEGAAEAEVLTTAVPRRRRDLQVSISRKGRHNVLALRNEHRLRKLKPKKVEIIKASDKRKRDIIIYTVIDFLLIIYRPNIYLKQL